jgi:alkylated DNA repair dioxygenase AlkB
MNTYPSQLPLLVSERAPQTPLSHAKRAVPLQLAMMLNHRQWLDLLADDWWPLKNSNLPLNLGVGAPIDVDLPDGHIAVIAWIDPAHLPNMGVSVLRDGQWLEIDLATLRSTDQAVLWPTAIPLFAIESFSTSGENERQRLLAFAKAYSGLMPLTQAINVGQHPPHRCTNDDRPDLGLLAQPDNWDAMRGAAAMAVWAVPAVGPWLDVLCESLSLKNNGKLADRLGAPWWNEPPWKKPQPIATAASYQMALWRAILTAFASVRIRDGWQPHRVLDQILAQLTAWDLEGQYLGQLDSLAYETRAILQDRQQVDAARGINDPLGLTLQLILLRPQPEKFATWRNDLLAMPPVVWWTGAVLSGLISGFRRLDAHHTGLPASRRLLALRIWQFSDDAPLAKNWPDLPGLDPTWRADDAKISLTWAGEKWAERKENNRGKWYDADLGQDKNHRAAIELARRYCPDSLCQVLRLKNVQLSYSGHATIANNSDNRILTIDGEIALRLPAKSSIADDLDEKAFREWILLGSIPDLLDAPPIALAHQVPTIPLSQPLPMQPDLLDAAAQPSEIVEAVVPGLCIIPDFISHEQESTLIQLVDQAPWLHELARRVQHYGWKYDYKSRKINRDAYLGPLPEWAQELAQRLLQDKLVTELPDQVIVNEYVGEQSISKHVDCLACFRGPVVTISLNETWEMIFRHPDTKEKIARRLDQCSAAILSGAARDIWTHEIPKRRKEPWGKLRGRRISLTFRKVNIG